MPAGRQKYNFYAVSNGSEVGIYTNWPQAGDSVLGFANAKYKGYITYSEAKSAMESAGFYDFRVFDGQLTLSKSEYEKQLSSECIANAASLDETVKCQDAPTLVEIVYKNQESEAMTVFIDGSCVRNGSNNAKAGYGLFWGVDHPWNGSYTISPKENPTNNKAELKAAIKAIQIAQENHVQRLVINSDSKYVISGITLWSDQWCKNGWKTANDEPVKNREEWMQLLQLIHDFRISVSWNHIPGHRGVFGNEEADKLAVKGATKQESGQKCVEVAQKDNQPAPKQQPKVIVISQKSDHLQNDVKTISDKLLNTTPRRKPVKDYLDTPVPGSINGSCIDKENAQTHPRKNIIPDKQVVSIDNDQLIRVMKNMETVMVTVLYEVNQSREESLKFKQDITKRFEEITLQQKNLEKFLLTFTQEISSEIRKECSQYQGLPEHQPREEDQRFKQDVTKKLEEITSNQKNFAASLSAVTQEATIEKKTVSSIFDGFKSSLHKLQTSCSDLKLKVDKAVLENKKECDQIQNIGKQIYDAVVEDRNESRRTREQVIDIEKAISAISEAATLSTINRKPKKIIDGEVKNNTSSEQSQQQASSAIGEDDDIEITFAKVVASNKEHPQTRTSERNDTKDIINPSTRKAEERVTHEERETDRKKMVYIIGDSIAGQLNVRELGKSTHTYVRRLRAPKIHDIEKYTEEVKNAKLIIIHAGINNLRDKESTESCINSMVEATRKLREKAPDAKLAVSKIIPVGEVEVAIDSTILNASCEKKLREIQNDVQFIDHSNLAEQGVPQKALYRQDMIHLSYRGVASFRNNIKRIIDNSLNQTETNLKQREIDQQEDGEGKYQSRRYRYDVNNRHKNSDHQSDGRLSHERRYDGRRRYNNIQNNNEERYNKYRGRLNSSRSRMSGNRDYSYEWGRSYSDRFDEHYNKPHYDRRYKDSTDSYHRDFDKDLYYRY